MTIGARDVGSESSMPLSKKTMSGRCDSARSQEYGLGVRSFTFMFFELALFT